MLRRRLQCQQYPIHPSSGSDIDSRFELAHGDCKHVNVRQRLDLDGLLPNSRLPFATKWPKLVTCLWRTRAIAVGEWGARCQGRLTLKTSCPAGSILASPKRNVDVRAHKTGTVTVGYERQLWEIADTLRASPSTGTLSSAGSSSSTSRTCSRNTTEIPPGDRERCPSRGPRQVPREGRARPSLRTLLSQFSSAEGKKGDELYTPRYVYDPCCDPEPLAGSVNWKSV